MSGGVYGGGMYKTSVKLKKSHYFYEVKMANTLADE